MIRAARPADLDRLVEIHLHAYPDERGHAARTRTFAENTRGGLDRLRVVERDGRLVGHGFAFSMSTWLGGREVAFGGIASVGVAPEARGRGVARELLEALQSDLAERGAAYSLLYPFRERFYARLGWAPVGPIVALELEADALRGALSPRARARFAPDRAFRTIAIADASRDELIATYERAAARHAGWLRRTAAQWDAWIADERLHGLGVVDEAGALRGWVAYRWDQPAIHGRTRLVVREIVADDDVARLALVDRVASLGDQADAVALFVGAGDPLLHAFLDAPGARRGDRELEHPAGRVGGGPMVRAIDLAKLASSRGWAADGVVTLLVHDGAGARTLRVEARGGEARATDTPDAAPDLETTSADATALLASGPTARELVALGRARARSADVVAALDAMLAGPRFHCLDPF